jgi:hypothetical protein
MGVCGLATFAVVLNFQEISNTTDMRSTDKTKKPLSMISAERLF